MVPTLIFWCSARVAALSGILPTADVCPASLGGASLVAAKRLRKTGHFLAVVAFFLDDIMAFRQI